MIIFNPQSCWNTILTLQVDRTVYGMLKQNDDNWRVDLRITGYMLYYHMIIDNSSEYMKYELFGLN